MVRPRVDPWGLSPSLRPWEAWGSLISVVASDPWDHLGRRVRPVLAVYATTTVVVTVAVGTWCAWYGLTGSFGCRTIAARTRHLILDTILVVTNEYSTVPVLLLGCNVCLRWSVTPPYLQGMVLGTRFHGLVLSSPPPGFALRRGVKRYPEPTAHGSEACEPSHPCGSGISLFSNLRDLESDPQSLNRCGITIILLSWSIFG